MITCPNCAHCWTPAKTARTAAAPTIQPALSTLSTTALYAAYKKSAPAEDVKFFLRTAILSPELRARVQALDTAITARQLTERTAIYRQLTELQDAWRTANYWQRVAVPAARVARQAARAALRCAA